MVEWIEVDELLDKSIGDIREMLAHEDSDSSFRTFLIENGWIADSDNEYDDDYDPADEDDYDEIEEVGTEILPSEEEEQLAQDIADDLFNHKYTADNLVGIYSTEIIDRAVFLAGEKFMAE